MSNNVPKIRFKGFTDDWEKYELNEVVNRYDNLRIPIAATERILGTTPYYGANGIQGYVEGYTHKGEFVLVAEDGANDLKNYPVQYVNGEIWVNNHAHVLQGKPDIAENKYLKYAISQMNIEPYLVGGGRAKLNAEIMMKMPIKIPIKFYEQVRIGDFLKNIDNLIELNQNKCNKLISVKKSMLEKMFPKKGEDTPEIRFKGFTEPWEKYKLDDISSIITKQTGFDYSETIKPSLITTKEEDTYPFIQNKDFDGENINLNTDFYIPVSVANKFPKIKIDTPSILISISGKIGNVGYYNLEEKAFIGGAVGICKLLKDNGSLIVYYLQSNSGQSYFNSLIKASSHSNITVEDIRKIEVLLPKSSDEEKKIREYFKSIDNLINQNAQKLEKLKNIKKSLLEKMFV